MPEIPPEAPEGGASPDPTVLASTRAGAHAAVLVDFQNLHHYLRGRADAKQPSADLAGLLLDGLRERLAADGTPVARGQAYADWPGLDDAARHTQRTLYLHGVEPVFVPASAHRNTTDLQLAVEAVTIVHTRPDVTTVALVSGDRDYAPVVQALLAAGRRVVVVGFKAHLTAALAEHAPGAAFVDGTELLPEGLLVSESLVGTPVLVTEFAEIQDPAFEIDYDALETIEKFFGHYDEIYLTPLLRRLSDEIGETDGHDPKSLVADLEECGAARLERRRGMPYDYTVLILNAEHPAVREVREELRGSQVATDGDDGLPFDAPAL